jgi:hypothetical protein
MSQIMQRTHNAVGATANTVRAVPSRIATTTAGNELSGRCRGGVDEKTISFSFDVIIGRKSFLMKMCATRRRSNFLLLDRVVSRHTVQQPSTVVCNVQSAEEEQQQVLEARR